VVLLASDYDKSRFFKADDIDGERKFRIKEATEETVGEGSNKETKLVVWFTNDKRGLVLNKTNNRVLRGLFGDDTAGWANKIIVVFSTMVELRGKMVPGLRVRNPPPKQASSPTVMSRGQETKPLGNGQTVAAKPKVVDDDLDEDNVKTPPAQSEADFDDEINF
jgi:hypothetical protein